MPTDSALDPASAAGPAAEDALEPRRRAPWGWLVVFVIALGGLTAFILVAAGDTEIPYIYTTNES